MSMPTGDRAPYRIEPIEVTQALIDLLSGAGLPTTDLNRSDAPRLVGAFKAETLAGCIGLELHGDDALLRSLAVAPAARRVGLARALIEYIEHAARAQGAVTLWLLTTGSADYFARLGYTQVDRALVPEAIRKTTQFASLCPVSAGVMCKSLLD